jgi:hypothetical protein
LANTYQAGARAYLDAPLYQQAISYTSGQYVVYSGGYYICTGATTGAFDPTKWSLIAPQYTIYSAILPCPEFDINTEYTVGSQVYWKGKTYTALQPSAYYDQQARLQYSQTKYIPPINTFPDTLVNGTNQQWGTGMPYNIPISTDIVNTAYWIQSDNRSQELVKVVVDIALYYAHERISPQNVPELRDLNYRMAIDWLKMASRGEVTPALPKLQPNQGGRIRYGSSPRNIFNY